MTRHRVRRLLAALAVAFGAALVPAAAASAHAELISTEPAENAVVTTAPAALRLTFTEPVETALGGVRLFDAKGNAVAVGQARHPDGRSDQVEVSTPGLTTGTYVVSWRVTSADSHPIQGSFLFSVGQRTEVTAQGVEALARTQGSAVVGGLLGASRFVVFAGFLALAGGLAYVTIFARAAPGTSSVIVTGALALAFGSFAAIVLQGGYANGTSLGGALKPGVWADTVHTEFGRQALLRIAIATVGAALGLVLSRADRVWWQAVALATGPLAALTIAYAGHGHTGRWATVGVVADVVHLVALAWWLGGLAVLAVSALRSGDGREAVRRFSPFAFGCVAAAIASGAVQSWRQLGSRDALATPYGRLLLVKLAAVVALVFAASVSRRALHRWTADLRTPVLLRRAVFGELAFGLVVLGVTAGLVSTPPGRDALARPFAVTLVSPQGARAEIGLEPAKAGPVIVHVYVTPPGGSLQQAAEARMTMSLPAKGVSDLAIPLALAGNNHFASTGARLPFAGRWEATVQVRFGDFDSYTFTTPIDIR